MVIMTHHHNVCLQPAMSGQGEGDGQNKLVFDRPRTPGGLYKCTICIWEGKRKSIYHHARSQHNATATLKDVRYGGGNISIAALT